MKRSQDVEIEEKVKFDSLLQNKHLLQGLKESGYERPSPVQLKAIPMGRLGVDMIAQAKSGTGKTVVFGVITLEAINLVIAQPQAIIIAPTREIAIQIRDVVRNLGRFMPSLQCHAFIGGISMQTDVQNANHSHIIVGTPGRLMALLESKKLSTTHIKLVVLDEADKLMSDTFYPQIDYIFSKMKSTVFQVVAFSATFTDELLQLVSKFLKNPQTVCLTDGVPTLNEVQQYYINTSTSDNESHLQRYKNKYQAVEKILGHVPFYQGMIFVNSLPRSMELSRWLNEMGWKSGHIHAGITQDKRLSVMEDLRDFKLRILVCSDLIARGIDVDRVNLVINLDLPWEVETYLHRVGRTGRYGTSGIAINLIGSAEDKEFLQKLRNEGIQIDILPDKVSHNKYVKQLTESDQKHLNQHESQKIESKPLILNHKHDRSSGSSSNAAQKKKAKKKHPKPQKQISRQTDTTHQEDSSQFQPSFAWEPLKTSHPQPTATTLAPANQVNIFIPPDLFF
ncbi:DEAD box polypeptide 20 [Mucor ambiguus]|uniref:RNA helicase n=1 Tax=Mucor ambiguus TaxID=91626 RepID=A0A0C9MQB8_9FUNG|nr:DEAD box polypeptide 20 [Mucor ambiguus]